MESVLKEVLNAEDSYNVDWTAVDFCLIAQFLENDNLSKKVSNLDEGIVKFFPVLFKYNSKIEERIKSNPELFEKLKNLYEIEEEISVSFFPQKNEFNYSNKNFKIPYEFSITEETKKQIKNTYKNLDFSIELKFIINKTNPFFYIEKNSLNNDEDSLLSLFTKETQSKIISLVVAGTLASSLAPAELEAKMLNYSKNGNKNKIAQLNRSALSFGENWEGLSQDHHTLLKKHAPTFLKLKISELKKIFYGGVINHDQASSVEKEYKKEYKERQREVASLINSYYVNIKKENKDQINKIAQAVSKESLKRKLDYKLMIAIIKTESSFRQGATNSSGDFSVAQVNFKKWSEEFERLGDGYPKLNKERLKTDIQYSVEIMAIILKILEDRHSKDDLWFARYHSGTPARKLDYAKKIESEIRYMENKKLTIMKEQIELAIAELHQIKKMEEFSHSEPRIIEIIQELSSIDQMIRLSILNKSPMVAFSRY